MEHVRVLEVEKYYFYCMFVWREAGVPEPARGGMPLPAPKRPQSEAAAAGFDASSMPTARATSSSACRAASASLLASRA